MNNYVYHHDDMDKDNRPPACYQLTYRGWEIGLKKCWM